MQCIVLEKCSHNPKSPHPTPQTGERSKMWQSALHLPVQETKLHAKNKTPTIPNYAPIRSNRPNAKGGGLITYIHNSIQYSDITQDAKALKPSYNTLELQAFKIETGNKAHTNIINISMPPDTSLTVPSKCSSQLQNLCSLPNTIIGGDINGKDTSWYTHHQPNTRGQTISHTTKFVIYIE